MPNAQTPVSSPPRFEIVREADQPRRTARRTAPYLFTALFGAIRSVVEDAYVSLAQETMVRTEQLGDARAERRHKKRLRANERQRLRAARHAPDAPAHGRATARPRVVH